MKKPAKKETESLEKKPVPVVAIGGSAGGMEAFTELLEHLSPETGMSYVYIQHLDPVYESQLAAILAKHTQMPVFEAEHFMRIEPNMVYVIPPNKNIEIVDGVLTLAPRQDHSILNLPIDRFFISLAERQKEGAIAVVLSGNASDGTQGLKAIKMAGGITFAQDASAKFHSMPKSAIAEGVVDLVLSPSKIAGELERLGKQTPIIQEVMTRTDDSEVPADQDEEMRGIIQLIKKSTGTDFSHYKINTIRRRMIRRMLLHQLETLEDYAKYMRQHTAEVSLLYNDLLINVTSFFRDAETTDYLQQTVLPRILHLKENGDPIRIWIPACSTGEEVYSIAILIMEVLGEQASNTAIQIFATDLSEAAIAKARLGIYSQQDVLSVGPKRLQRFFTKVDHHYRIVKQIRDLCVFAPHNVFRDPPFSRIDVISCCNLLIYLDATLQKKIIATFHYALNTNGYLILGRSETIGNSTQLFSQIDKKYKLYARRNDSVSRLGFEMVPLLRATERPGPPPLQKIPVKENTIGTIDLEEVVNNVLLHQYTPASVVINQGLEIMQFRGATSVFLEPASGKASLNLLKMARPGLAFELRNAVRKCIKSGQTVQRSGLEIKIRDKIQLVGFEVLALNSISEDPLFLVILREEAAAYSASQYPAQSKNRRVKELEEELITVREDMRSIIEEQETSNEELQSANEEIVSSNEELQSINEELETSKEEIESSNEELMTINQELQSRNTELAEANDYAETIFNTIQEAVLTLDKDLRIRSVNNAFIDTFNVQIEDTQGRLLYELGNRQWDIPELRLMLEEVMTKNAPFKGYEITHTFPLIGEKVMLLSSRKIMRSDHRQQLVLLAIEDITERRQAEQLIAEREMWFRQMSDNAPVMIWVASPDKRRTFFNRTWLEFTGRTLEQEIGNGWLEGVHPDDRMRCLEAYTSNLDVRQAYQIEYRLRRHDGDYRWTLGVDKPSYSPSGEFTGYIGTCTDIHAQKVLNEELDKHVKERTRELLEVNTQLERSNDELQQFAYVASHDLQEPLRKIVTFSNILQQRFQPSLPTEGIEHLNKISSASHRMSLLIDDLLNFARTTRKESEFVGTDLNQIYRNVILDFDLIISEQKADIQVDNLPTLEAIPLQMTQLFRNLISNALKFSTTREQPTVRITSHSLDHAAVSKHLVAQPDTHYCELIFSDNGIGFSPEFSEHIFTIFKRLHDKQTYAGTGIGLALCRRIVLNHGGDIYALSSENAGASFHVILPAVHVTDPTD